MFHLLLFVLSALLLLLLGALYIVHPTFVRMIARRPEAVDSRGGTIIRIGIGVVLLIGAGLCTLVVWNAITM